MPSRPIQGGCNKARTEHSETYTGSRPGNSKCQWRMWGEGNLRSDGGNQLQLPAHWLVVGSKEEGVSRGTERPNCGSGKKHRHKTAGLTGQDRSVQSHTTDQAVLLRVAAALAEYLRQSRASRIRKVAYKRRLRHRPPSSFYPKFHCEFNFIERRAKWFARENCGFDFEALKAIAPEALASVVGPRWNFKTIFFSKVCFRVPAS